MNEVWYVKYHSKYWNENKIVDISTLHLVDQYYYIANRNHVACVWKRSLGANFEPRRISDYGWDKKVNICWIEEPFPKDIEEILNSDKCNEN